MSARRFLPLPENFEPTRATLHLYANAVGVIPKIHAEPHDKWWHLSLSVVPRGLETKAMQLPAGGELILRLDLVDHQIVVVADGRNAATFAMTDGLTGTEMGDAVIDAVATLGLEGEYDRTKFESAGVREYEPAVAATFLATLTDLAAVLSIQRHRTGAGAGPLQLWPHGFDLSFEWFGTRVEEFEEHGELKQLPAQCNFGFYPGGRSYLYSNPWPFEGDSLLSVDLPGAAEWHTEGWQGSILYYDLIAGTDAAEQMILDYFKAVFEAAKPTLSA